MYFQKTVFLYLIASSSPLLQFLIRHFQFGFPTSVAIESSSLHLSLYNKLGSLIKSFKITIFFCKFVRQIDCFVPWVNNYPLTFAWSEIDIHKKDRNQWLLLIAFSSLISLLICISPIING